MENNKPEPPETVSSDRRRFLAALGGVSITGLAGCVGDDGTDTPTGGEETTDPSTTTQQPTDTPTDTATDTPTDTPDETCNISEEMLLSFDGGLQFEPGEEKAVTATVSNPYLFEITNGSVTLDPPSEGWTISGPANDTNTFDSLAVGGSQTTGWTITAPASASEGPAITVTTSYENCDGSQSVEFTAERTVSIDAYAGKEFDDLAAVYEYYDGLDADSDTPGDLGADSTVTVSLDLSGGEEHLSGTVDYTDNRSFQLRFGDYFEDDGFGGRLLSIEVLADGEAVASFDSGSNTESEFLVMNNGSSLDADSNRFADATQTWTYQFPVPEGSSELIANIDIENQFTVEGRGGASGGGGGTANARIAHMSPDAPNVDVYVDGGDPVLSGVPFGTVSDYLEVPAGERQVEITEAGNADNSVFNNTITVEADTDYTVVAAGHLGDGDQPFEVLTFVDDNSDVGDTDARLRAVHVSPDAPAVDITAGGGSPVLFDGVAYGQSGYTTVAGGDYTVEVRADTDTNDGAIQASFDNVSLDAGTVYTAFAAGNLDPSNSPGGEAFDLIVVPDSTDAN